MNASLNGITLEACPIKKAAKLHYLKQEAFIMKKYMTIGIDLAKNNFQLAIMDQHQKLISNKTLSRNKLQTFLANHPACVIGMEACSSAHYWAGVFSKQGHEVKLLPPVFVKGFVYGNKNDANDAKAIALAVNQPTAPTVQIKTPEQLSLQAIMRVRERRVNQRTQCSNQIRGLLAEHGVIIVSGIRSVRQIDRDRIPNVIQPLIRSLLEELEEIDQRLEESEETVQRIVNEHPLGRHLLSIPGIGKLNALAMLVTNPLDYKNGRHFAAYLGLVPRQTGTGGKVKLLGISKRGNQYQRELLCHGARAFLSLCKDDKDPLLKWAKAIKARKGINVAVVALANKLARISWHVMNGEVYDVKLTVHQ